MKKWFKEVKKVGSKEESEVAGFFVFSHIWFIGYLFLVRLGKD